MLLIALSAGLLSGTVLCKRKQPEKPKMGLFKKGLIFTYKTVGLATALASIYVMKTLHDNPDSDIDFIDIAIGATEGKIKPILECTALACYGYGTYKLIKNWFIWDDS